jgi:hypothetical protein
MGLWAYCPERGCLRRAAIPLRPALAHFGGDGSSDRLRCAPRCTALCHRGALLQLPSWSEPEFREGQPVDQIPPRLASPSGGRSAAEHRCREAHMKTAGIVGDVGQLGEECAFALYESGGWLGARWSGINV